MPTWTQEQKKIACDRINEFWRRKEKEEKNWGKVDLQNYLILRERVIELQKENDNLKWLLKKIRQM